MFAQDRNFGLLAYPFCIIGVWLLDLAMRFYHKIGDYILLGCVAAVNVATIALISTDYTTVLVTNGFLLIPLFALMIEGRSGRNR